ncbi:serine hydrolase [Geodermatophilus nigrescens]|uniref:serine hydrolase n=1 Tax=Geodermatophilus nigrescens TaxID=1070870 RepID=UPI000934B30E|nr:serine hydrolase [Geodermatophilus nigrescens]
MSAQAVAPPRAGRPARALLVPAAVLLLLGSLLGAPGRAAAGPPAAEVVPAVAGAWTVPGTLAVALTVQAEPAAGLTRRALDAGDARTGRRTADNGAAADRPFPTASMVKLFLAEDLLHRARAGSVALDGRDWRLLQEMIRSSDDPAASELWVRFDGPRMVRDVAARYGLTGTAPPADPSQWGETTTTARDLARFLAELPRVAAPADAATLLAWMRTATPLAADGFDQRFGAFGTLPGMPAVKQGWMCCVDGQRHLHSVAVSGDRVVVLLSEVPRSVSYDQARAALSAAAAALPPPRA